MRPNVGRPVCEDSCKWKFSGKPAISMHGSSSLVMFLILAPVMMGIHGHTALGLGT